MVRIILLTGFVLAAITGFPQISDDSIRIYNDSIAKYRTGKNIRMIYSESTPLTEEQQRKFTGLNYFSPDIKFCVEATVHSNPEKEIVFMQTSTDRLPEYIKYGEVRFRIDTTEYTLTAYQSKKLIEVKPDENYLFIPFRDATNGDQTYEGGRYIDCKIPEEGNTTQLDFNKAYNPYCAYNPRFSCVIPPEENRLKIPVEAGEKRFK